MNFSPIIRRILLDLAKNPVPAKYRRYHPQGRLRGERGAPFDDIRENKSTISSTNDQHTYICKKAISDFFNNKNSVEKLKNRLLKQDADRGGWYPDVGLSSLIAERLGYLVKPQILSKEKAEKIEKNGTQPILLRCTSKNAINSLMEGNSKQYGCGIYGGGLYTATVPLLSEEKINFPEVISSELYKFEHIDEAYSKLTKCVNKYHQAKDLVKIDSMRSNVWKEEMDYQLESIKDIINKDILNITYKERPDKYSKLIKDYFSKLVDSPNKIIKMGLANKSYRDYNVTINSIKVYGDTAMKLSIDPSSKICKYDENFLQTGKHNIPTIDPSKYVNPEDVDLFTKAIDADPTIAFLIAGYDGIHIKSPFTRGRGVENYLMFNMGKVQVIDTNFSLVK